MNETDQVISVGDPMPRLVSVAWQGAYGIAVRWAPGSAREHDAGLVDLAPLILTLKFYKPLRDNSELLETVHTIEDGSAIAWGADDAIDMAATSIERLAEEQMSSADFRAWLEQHKLTYDAAAAQLGISRRLVAYYADERPIPRYIALACRYLDLVLTLNTSEGANELAERLSCIQAALANMAPPGLMTTPGRDAFESEWPFCRKGVYTRGAGSFVGDPQALRDMVVDFVIGSSRRPKP
jgi:hypothetical protein